MFAMHLLSEGGEIPNTSLLPILLGGIALFVLIIALGWVTGGAKQEEPAAPAHDSSPTHH